ncbi:MAG: signal peptidase I [bacterium]|nr:signal peptidase I [bacterium]
MKKSKILFIIISLFQFLIISLIIFGLFFIFDIYIESFLKIQCTVKILYFILAGQGLISLMMVHILLKMKLLKTLIIFIITLILSSIIYWYGYKYLSCPEQKKVQGKSMLPTLQNDDIINCSSYQKNDLSRKDIVIFKHADKEYIKRIIGLPEDKIAVSNFEVFLNNEKIEEKYILNNHSTNLWENGFIKTNEPIIVPNNKLFILGDNRLRSSDSREFGFIDKNDISCIIPWKEQYIFTSKWNDKYKKSFEDYEVNQNSLSKFISNTEIIKLLNNNTEYKCPSDVVQLVKKFRELQINIVTINSYEKNS